MALLMHLSMKLEINVLEVIIVNFSSLMWKKYDLDEVVKTFIDCNNVTTKYNELEHELL